MGSGSDRQEASPPWSHDSLKHERNYVTPPPQRHHAPVTASTPITFQERTRKELTNAVVRS
eukprot:1162992-Rhodomonas_salina.2